MFRKFILTAVVATGTVAGVAATPATADAQPFPIPSGPYGPRPQWPHGPHGPGYPQRDRHDFLVLVRHHGHWDRYRVFDDRDDAQRAVWWLERRGYDARIQVIHRH